MAYDTIVAGGTAPCILNAANEVAVERFLHGKIKFTQISGLIQDALNSISNHKIVDLNSVLDADRKTREHLNRKFN